MSASGPTQFKPYEGISNELWMMVLEYLPNSTLRRIPSVSKLCHNFSIPAIYYTVHFFYNAIIMSRQPQFIVQVLTTPEYGRYVGSFTWAMGYEHVLWNYEDKSFLAINREFEEIYQILSPLDKATSVHLQASHYALINKQPSFNIKYSFPNAGCIELEGNMEYNLASVILHDPNKAQLHLLALNNIQHPGRIRGWADYSWSYNNRYNDWRAEWNDLIRKGKLTEDFEDWPIGSSPVAVVCGNIRRLFTPSLRSRCKDLQWPKLFKQGQQNG
ncbi:hypothetical protein B7494_g2405 [Chlorociboria aeruginascens]|nr:hypothetical protein B7494_g2405 [Chlorociboria aeruginascens]